MRDKKKQFERNQRWYLKKFTEVQKARFKELWLRGVAVKIIEQELDLHRQQLIRLRAYMELPPRQVIGQPMVQIRANIPPKLMVAVRKRCIQRGQYLSAYIRYLIERDNGC